MTDAVDTIYKDHTLFPQMQCRVMLLLLGVTDVPYIATISDLLCFPILVLIIPHAPTRAFWL
jgi:hypothetical protein